MELIYLIASMGMLFLLIILMFSFGSKIKEEEIEVIIKLEKWKQIVILMPIFLILLFVAIEIYKRRFNFQAFFWVLVCLFNIFNMSLRVSITTNGIRKVDLLGRKGKNILISWNNIVKYKIVSDNKLILYYSTEKTISKNHNQLIAYKIDISRENKDFIKNIILKHNIAEG